MRAVKVIGRVERDHTLTVRLPDDVEEGPAEVIVLLPEHKVMRPSLAAFLDSLSEVPRPRRSKGEIDAALDEGRASWDP